MTVSSNHPGLRFTRLRLTNWRNFRGVDIHLAARAFFVGPNASGKSNLLDALRFLSEIAKPGSGGLQAAIDSRGGLSALRCLHARKITEVEIDACVGNDADPDLWRYRLAFKTFRKEKFPTVVMEHIEHKGRSIEQRKRMEADDALEFSQTLLEQVGASKDFRPLSEFLGSGRYLHVVPQIVRDRSRARAEGEDPYGGDLLRRMKDMPKKTRIPRLERIGKALRIAVPQFRKIELSDDSAGVPHLFATYEHWRHHAARQSEEAFSDGTLRLIGLLWSIAEKGGPLFLEEPELSLNDSVVSELPKMFTRMQRLSNRQVITTTHSSALLDDPGIGLKEVHLIFVDKDGSQVKSIDSDKQILAQTSAGMSIGQAIMPLLRPNSVDQLGRIDVAA